MGKIIDAEGNVIPTCYPSPALRRQMEEDERKAVAGAITPGPWKACRSHEDYDGPMFDLDDDERAEYDARPFVRIIAPSGESVAAAHDLFEFRREDAVAIAALPDLIEALEAATAYVELYTGNGVRKQPPTWAILPNGDFDPEAIAKVARAALARANG